MTTKKGSEILESMIQQMDGLLSGNVYNGKLGNLAMNQENGNVVMASPMGARRHGNVLELLEVLRRALEDSTEHERLNILIRAGIDTRNFYKQWLQDVFLQHQSNGVTGMTESLDDRIHKLEVERDSLSLQVSVLTDQVEAQTDKIHDLESVLNRRDSSLTHELVSRSTLETHKLDLMAEVSQLKIRLASSEKERRELEDKLAQAQRRIDDLQSRFNEKTIELSELKNTLTKTVSSPSADHADATKSLERERSMEKEKTLERLRRKHSEVEKLKKAVECLMASNDEKDRRIDDLRRTLKKHKRLEELGLTSHNGKDLVVDHDEVSDSSSTQNSSSSGAEHTIKDVQSHQNQNGFDRLEVLEAGDNRLPTMPNPSATSTPVSVYKIEKNPALAQESHTMTPPSLISYHQAKTNSLPRSNSVEELSRKNVATKTPPAPRQRTDGYGTLPINPSAEPVSCEPMRAAQSQTLQPRSRPHVEVHSSPTPKRVTGKPPRGTGGGNSSGGIVASFGKGLRKLGRNKWSTSAPNLEADEALKDAMAQEYKNLQMNAGRQPPSSQDKKKQKGIKKFFGKLRRSSSQDMNQEQLEEFRRSGLRATAGPRLGWSRDLSYKDIDVPFARWDADQVAAWLHSLGLSMYVGDCKRWVKNGNQLLKASQHDMDKELNMKNPFHRKKLTLALQSITSENPKSGMDRLDHNMVTRWLDDIGLPQYKDVFLEARVDGRMLHHLTMEDLVGLKVTNALHHLSLKSAIHVLRCNNFNSMCLIRRPSPDEGYLHNIPHEVMLWSNHRVMEWLRTIDLSEYAPNLRGSGVHGGLMVLEPRFGSDVFATILSIPSSKTLLRRHLSTHFVSLIGNDHQHRKRELEARPGFMPLTPNQKIKFKKFGIFGHKRTRSSEVDFEEYVCPLEASDGSTRSPITNGSAHEKHKEKKDLKESKDSGAYSNEMDTLTSMLAKDRFLDNVPTSDV